MVLNPNTQVCYSLQGCLEQLNTIEPWVSEQETKEITH